MIFKNFNSNIKLDELFRYETKNNSYIIDLSISDYNSLYSSLDFSPQKNKDLDDGLVEYLEDSVEDIPLKYNIIIEIHLSQEIYNIKSEKESEIDIKNYFEYLKRKKIRVIKYYYKDALISLILGSIFLFVVYGVKENIEHSKLFLEVVLEGINVGGWVFFWEFFSLIFISPHKDKIKVRQYQRIIKSQIRFSYTKEK
jgi:hypothetical protein